MSAGDSYRNRALPLYNLVVHLQGKVEELEADLSALEYKTGQTIGEADEKV